MAKDGEPKMTEPLPEESGLLSEFTTSVDREDLQDLPWLLKSSSTLSTLLLLAGMLWTQLSPSVETLSSMELWSTPLASSSRLFIEGVLWTQLLSTSSVVSLNFTELWSTPLAAPSLSLLEGELMSASSTSGLDGC